MSTCQIRIPLFFGCQDRGPSAMLDEALDAPVVEKLEEDRLSE
jgi:hypothetical protein